MEVAEIISGYLAYCNRQTALTEEQKTALEVILAKYDPENMTQEDRRGLENELGQAGVPFNGETGRILKKAGFMSPPLEGTEAEGPAPAPSSGEAQEKNSGLLNLINQVKSGRIDEDEFLSLLLDYAESNGSFGTGKVIDKSV